MQQHRANIFTTSHPFDKFNFVSNEPISEPLISESGEVEAIVHERLEMSPTDLQRLPILTWAPRLTNDANAIGSYYELDRELSQVMSAHGELCCTSCGGKAQCRPWYSLVGAMDGAAVLVLVVPISDLPPLTEVNYIVEAQKLIPVSQKDLPQGSEAVLLSTGLPLSAGEEERIAHVLATSGLRGRLMSTSLSRETVTELGYFPFQCSCVQCGSKVAADSVTPRADFSPQFEYRLKGLTLGELQALPIDQLEACLQDLNFDCCSELKSLLALLRDFGLGACTLTSQLHTLSPLELWCLDGVTLSLCGIVAMSIIVDDIESFATKDSGATIHAALKKMATAGATLYRIGGPAQWLNKSPSTISEGTMKLFHLSAKNLPEISNGAPNAVHHKSRTVIADDCRRYEQRTEAAPLLVAAGFYEVIAPNYSRTLEARMNGISTERILFPTGDLLCSLCGGAGTTTSLEWSATLPCSQCAGRGFALVAAGIEVAGIKLGDLWQLRCGELPESYFATEAHAELYRYFLNLGFRPLRMGFPFHKLFLAEKRRVILFRSWLQSRNPEKELWILENLTPGLSSSRFKTYLDILARIRASGVELMAVEPAIPGR